MAAAQGSKVEIGGQNLYWAKEGAFTGEVSAPMLVEVGSKWVIIGHSERRQYFGETDETVFQKTVAALDGGLNPIVCIGERLEEREAGKTEPVLLAQLRGGLGQLATHQIEKADHRLRAGLGHRHGQDRHARKWRRKRTATSAR